MRILPQQGSSGRVFKKTNHRHLNHRKTAMNARRRRMFLEQLEQRSLLAVLTWDGSGADNLWSNPANWDGDVAPVAGDDLVFPVSASSFVSVNDLPAGTRFNTILIQGSGYSITGAAIQLNGGLTANNTTGSNMFGLETTVLNSQSFVSANPGATLTISSDIHTGSLVGTSQVFTSTSALLFDGSGSIHVTGSIDGSGSLSKLGSGTLILSGANTYEGITDVRQGVIVADHNSALGLATTGETHIQAGASLHIQGGRTIAESFAVREGGVGYGNGTDGSTLGALRSISGLNTITGNVELMPTNTTTSGNVLIGADAGSTLVISGVVAGSTSLTTRFIKVGDGTLRLTGTADNVFRGDTVVLKGTLELNKSPGRNAIGGNLIIGDHIGGDNGATVRLLASNQIPHLNYFGTALNTVTVNSSGLLDFGGNSDVIGNLVLTTGAAYSADIDLNGGTLTLGGASLTLNASQGTSGASPAATIQDGTLNIESVFSGAGGGITKAFVINDTQVPNVATDLIISANLAGPSNISITRSGTGTLQFGGTASTFAGSFIWTGGIVEVAADHALGTGLIALQNDGNTFKAVGNRTIGNPVSLDASLTNFIGSDNLTFTGNFTLTGSVNSTRTLRVMDPAQTVTISGVIGEGIFGTQNLAKGGRGTLALEGANTYSGSTVINNDGGTLVLRGGGTILNSSAITVGNGGVFKIDNNTALPGGANLTDRVNDATTITLNGAKLHFVSDSVSDSSEYMGLLSVGANLGNSIELEKTSPAAFTSSLTVNSLSGTNADRTVSFIGTGAPLSDSPLPGANRFSIAHNPAGLDDGILPMGVVLGPGGAVDLATYGSSPEGTAIIPLPASAYVTDINQASPTSNVRLSADAVLTSNKIVNSILIDPNVSLTGAGATLSVASGRMVLSDGSLVGVSYLNTGSGGITVLNGTATIASDIYAGAVQKGGRGTLVLASDNQTPSAINVNEGILEVQTAGGLGSPAGVTTVRQGATLQFNGSFSMGVEAITLTGAGFNPNAPGSGFDTYATSLGALRLVGGNASYAGTVTLAGDATDLTGLTGGYLPTNFANTTTINVSSGTLNLTGAVTANIELLKRGSGQLEYSGAIANSNDQPTRVLEGTLFLNKEPGVNAIINHVEVGSDAPGAPPAILRLGGSDQIRDDRGVRIRPSGLFDLNGNSEVTGAFLDLVIGPTGAGDVTLGSGTLTTNSNLNVFTIGTGNPTGATISGGTLALQLYGIVASPGTRTWLVTDGAAGDDLTVTSSIVDGTGLQSVGIIKDGYGTLVLGGTSPNSFTGTTTINDGTLALAKPDGVTALSGAITIGNNNPDSGFSGSDVLELRHSDQIADFMSAAMTIAATGKFVLNGNNETLGQTDGQTAISMQASSMIDLGGGTLTMIGNLVSSAATGVTLWTVVSPPRIVGGTLALGNVPRIIDQGGDRLELPYELEISANLTGTGGFALGASSSSSGTLLLTGDNSGLSGDVFRTNGNLAIGSDSAMGTGRVLINGGHLATYGGKRTLANPFNIMGTISMVGGNGIASSGNLGGGGNDLTFTGPVNIVFNTNGSTLIVPVAAQVEFAGGLGETYGGVPVTKNGYGTLILSSVGSYSGTTTVNTNGGTFVIRDQGTALNTAFTVNHGGTLQIDNRTGANLSNRIGDTAGITLTGGNLALVGQTGGISSEAAGTLTVSDNTNGQVHLLLSPQGGSNATWRFTNYNRTGNNGGMLTFVGRGVDIGATSGNKLLFNLAPGLVNSILPTAVIINPSGPEIASIRNPVSAAVDPTYNALEPYTAETAPLIGGLGTFSTTLVGATATTNVKLTSSQSLTADTAANAVLLAGDGLTIGETAASILSVTSGLVASVGGGNSVATTGLTLNPAESFIWVDGDLTIDSNIAGAATALAKNGPGMLVVGGSGANTFTGITRVNTGIFRAAKPTAFGTTAGNVNVAISGTVELVGGITVPAETITLNGNGESNTAFVPLRNVSGVNTWLGNVTLNSNRTAINVAAGSTLNVEGVLNNNGFNKLGEGTLILGGSANNTLTQMSIIWQGTVALNKSGGALALNSTANPTIQVGDFVGGDDADRLIQLQDEQITNNAGSGSQAIIQINASGLYDLNGHTETFGSPSLGQDSTSALNMFAGQLYSATVDLNGGTIHLVAGNGGSNRVMNLVANVSASIGGGIAAPVRIDDGTVTITNGTTGPAVHDINVVDGAGIEDLVITANIVDGTGTGGLDKTNPGRLVLHPAVGNTYSGTTNITSGEILVRGTTPLGDAAGGTSVSSGASLLIDNVSSADPLTINGAGFNGQSVIRSLGGNNDWSGGVTLGGAVTIGVDAGRLILGDAITGGAVGLNKIFDGTLQLSGSTSNTFTGTVVVLEGTLELNKSGGAVAVQGRLEAGNDNGVGGATANVVRWLQSEQLGPTSQLVANTEGLFDLNGQTQTYVNNLANGVFARLGPTSAGRFDLGGGTLVLQPTGNLFTLGTNTTGNNIASPPGYIGNGNLVIANPNGGNFTLTDALNPVDFEIAASIANIGGDILKLGAGTLALTGNNSSTLVGHALNLSAGGLALGSGNALGDAASTLNVTANTLLLAMPGGPGLVDAHNITLNANLTIRGNANVALNGTITNSGGNRVLDSNVNAGNTVTLGGTINLSNDNTGRVLTINNSTFGGGVVNGVTGGDVTVSAQIVNGGTAAGGFTKGGVGLLTLTNNTNSYTGTTVVSAGSMRVTAEGVLGGKVAEQQSFGVTSTGGGSFTITYTTGNVTVPLAFTGTTPPSAAEVENAINALPAVARTGGFVSVTSSNPAGPSTIYTLTFGGALEGVDVTQVTVAPTAPVTVSTAVSTPVPGSGYTTVQYNAATLQVVGGLNMTEPLDLGSNGFTNNHAQGFGNFGALRLVDLNPGVTETTTWSVPIRYGNTTGSSQSWFGVDGGGANPDRLILNGALGSASGALGVKVGAGELEIGGATDNSLITWNGVSQIDDGFFIREGTLILSKPEVGGIQYAAITGSGTVTVGDGGGGANADRLILNGTSQDQLGGTGSMPVVVGASGHFSLDGGIANETLRGTLTIQRLAGIAGTIDTSPTRTLTLGGNVTISNAGVTTDATPPAVIAGNLILGGTRTFDVHDSFALDPAEDLVISAIISGSGAGITKQQSGTMTLTSANTYTGTTTVNAATLDSNSASFNNGSNVKVLGTLVARDAGTLGTGAVAVGVGATLVLDDRAASANRIADTAVVTLTSANLVLLGNAAGTNETILTLQLNSGENVGQANRVTVDSTEGGVTVLQTTNLNRGGSASADFFGVGDDLGSTTNSRILVTSATSPFVNAVLPWATVTGPAGFDLVTDADGASATAPYFLGRVPLYSNDINAGGIVRLSGGTHTLTADRTVDALLLEDGATVDGPFTLSVGTGTTPGLVVTRTGSNVIATTGGATTPGLQFGGRDLLFLIDGDSTLSVTGNIAGTGPLRKERSGTLRLTGDNDDGAGRQFTGSTTVNAGTLVAAHDDVFGTEPGGAVVVNRRATLVLDTSLTDIDLGNKTLTISGLGLNDGGSGVLRVIGTNTASIGTGATVVTFGTNPTIVNVDSGAVLSLNANVSGSSPIIKIGGGEMIYTGSTSNASTGALSVNEGILTLDKSGAAVALAGSTTVDDLGIYDPIGGGVLRYSDGATSTNMIGNVSITVNYPGVFDINGKTDETTGTLAINGGTYQNTLGGGSFQVNGLTTTGGLIDTGTGAINLNGNFTYTSGLSATAGTVTIAGNLNLMDAQRTFTVNDGYAVNEVIVDATLTGGRLVKSGTGGLQLNNPGNSLAGVNEVQRITVTGAAAGSSQFRINFNGNLTGPITVNIDDNVTAAAIDAALEALPNVRAGGVSVTVAGAGVFDIEFTGHLAEQDIINPIVTSVVTSPGTFAVSTVVAGQAGIQHNSGILGIGADGALGNAVVQVGTAQILAVGGERTIANRLVLNNNTTTTFGGRRDFGGTHNLTFTGGITLQSSTSTGQTVGLDVPDNQTLVTISGVISGGGNFIVPAKRGIGTLVLSGNNTFDTRDAVNNSSLTSSDGIRVEAGILRLAHSNALGDPTQIASVSVYGHVGAVLELDGTTPNGDIILTGRVLDIAGADNNVARGYLNRSSSSDLFTGILRSLGGNNRVIAPNSLAQVRLRHQNDNSNDTSIFWSVDSGSLEIDGAIVGLENDATPTTDTGRSLYKTGSGTLRLSGATQNNIAGTIGVLHGTLELNKADGGLEAGLAIAGTLQVGDNVTPASVVWLNNEQVVLAMPINVSSTGTINLNNFVENTSGLATLTVGETSSAQVLTGNAGNWVHRNSVTVVLLPGVTAAAPPVLISGHVQLTTTAAVTSTYTVNDGPGEIELNLNANLTEGAAVGSLTKAGFGRMAMTSPDASTFTGNVSITSGTLRIHGDDDLGTHDGSTTISSGASLELVGNFTETGESLTVNGTGIINGVSAPVFTSGHQAMVGTGAVRSLGGTIVWEGNIVLNSSPAGIAVVSGEFIHSGAGVMSGGNALLKLGEGVLELGGTTTNTFSGNTYLNQGTLRLNKQGAAIAINGGEIFLGDNVGGDDADMVLYAPTAGTDQIGNRVIRISSTGVLNLNGVTDTNNQAYILDVGPAASADILTGAGTLLFNNSISSVSQAGLTAASPSATIQGTIDMQGASRTFDIRDGGAPIELHVQAVIAGGAGGLTKMGRGTLAISGNNTYTGTTALGADVGTLLVNTPPTVAASTFNIGAGSTLGGTGTINGPVNLQQVASNLRTGGILNPGSTAPAPNNTGILTVNNNVSFAAGSIFLADINGTTPGTDYDQLVVGGTGNVTITGNAGPTPSNTAMINGTTGMGFQPVNGVDQFKLINKTSPGEITGPPIGSFLSQILPQPPLSSPSTVLIGGKTYSTTYNVAAGLNDGNDFVLEAIATTRVWDGEGNLLAAPNNNWSWGPNWVGDFAPFSGDSLLFGDLGDTRESNNNDFVGFSFGEITLNKTTGDAYVLEGNAVTLSDAGGGITQTGANVTANVIKLAEITLASNPQTITNASSTGLLTINSQINGNEVLNLAGLGSLTFTGEIGGGTPLAAIVAVDLEDLTFASTIATTGNVTLTGGTGVTTLSGGVVGGLLNLEAESFVLGGSTLTVVGPATLMATVGDVADDNGAANNLTAPSLTVTAVTGIDLDTTIVDLTATNTGAGDVKIDEANQLNILGLLVANGNATITAGGALTDGPTAITSVSGNASFSATSITLGDTAGDAFDVGTLTFASTGAVIITENSDTQLVGANAASSLNLTSGGALTNAAAASVTVTNNASFGGSSVTLGNQVGDTMEFGSLSFTSAGAVIIAEDNATILAGASTADSLVLNSTGSVTNNAAASVTVANNASLTATSISLGAAAGDTINFGSVTFNATAGDVELSEDSAIDLLGANLAMGSIVLSSPDQATAGQDINLPVGSSLTSTLSGITLNAGDNVTLAGNVSAATTLQVDVDNSALDNGVGGTVEVSGMVLTTGGSFFNGHNDGDTFTLKPQAGSAFTVNGNAPTTFPGDVLNLDLSGAVNPLLTLGGIGSGTWTFDPPLQTVVYNSIEQVNSTGANYDLVLDTNAGGFGNTGVDDEILLRTDGTDFVIERTGQAIAPDDDDVGVIFQGAMSAILSFRYIGSNDNDIVTVSDAGGLFNFTSTAPGAPNNPNLAGTAEFLLDGGGGTDRLIFALTGASVSQTYAIGNGSGAPGTEGEIETVSGGVTLLSYFTNVEQIERTDSGPTPGTLSVVGDLSPNAMSVVANGASTQVAVPGYVPFEFTGNNYSGVTVSGGLGADTLELLSIGAGQTNPLAITLNGDAGADVLRVHSTSGNTGVVTLNGGAGNDQFLLYDASNTVDAITGQVVVDGSDGNVAGNTDTLTIVDTGDLTPDSVLIAPENPGVNADYRIEGINSTAGNDVVFRNIDVLNYTGTQGDDLIDARFDATTPPHDLSEVTISGWLGGDQFLLFTSDQAGGSGPGVTPTGVPSGVAIINLYGDAPGNPNALDGHDIFGETPPGLVGTGAGNVGLVVPDTVRMIRPSASTAINIDGGEPTGPADPTSDTIGDVFNVDISDLPGGDGLILPTVGGVLAAGGIQPLAYTQIEDINVVYNHELINVQLGDTLVVGTDGADLIQFMKASTVSNPNRVRVRVNTLVVDLTLTGKTLTFGGASNDYITQSNVTLPAEMYGEDGNDYIAGGMGNDFLVGGLGHDQINASGGDNVVWGDNAPSSLVPNPQDLPIGGDDTLSGLDGNDVFYGGGGNDHVSAGGGDDYVYGGAGNDSIAGAEGDDRLYGGDGDDVIGGGAGNDLISGGAGNDNLLGYSGDDVIIGGFGSDTISGDNGKDILITGSVANEHSSFTSVPSVGNYNPSTYSQAADADAALLALLVEWTTSGTYTGLQAITHDGVDDDIYGGLGDDEFCWEAADITDEGPSLSPPDFNTLGMGNDNRFGPT